MVLAPGNDASPEDLATALEKLRAVHASLRKEELLQWTLADIPDFAEEPYCAMAAFLAGPDYMVPVPKDMWDYGMSEIRRAVQLQAVGRVTAEYF
jgi:hypothetical protein